jgi:general secretion pathway protein J
VTARPSEAAGFTLLEVLVGLIVFGFIMLGLAQGFRFGVHAMGLEANAVRRQTDTEAVDRALRGLLRRTARSSTALMEDEFQGSAHTLAFTTVLPQAGEAAAQLVDVGLGVDQRHRLVLRWTPRYVRPIGPAQPPRTVVLLDGVDHVDFAYWQGAQAPAGWAAAWPQGDGPPELVRLRLVFADAARARWPDIVAATRGG